MDTLLTHVGQVLLDTVLPPLATAVAALAVAVLARYTKKLGLDLTAQQEARLRVLVADTVKRIEEQARRAPMSSQQKATRAIGAIARQRPDLSDAEIRDTIDAVLPDVRATTTAPVPRHPGMLGSS